ncbi:MAG: hypothetical protein JWM99_2738 [Verrucomicrobiales bacterium]|nr:hypothetical protein [Verrucomicrobiales bacterium]
MKRQTLFFACIVVLNGALWFFFGRERDSKTGARTISSLRPVTNQIVKVRPAPTVVIRTNSFQWEQLESEDYRSFITRLRAIGCPEETIRDIIIADLDKLMAPRIQATDGPHEPAKYWKPQRKQLTRTVDSLEKDTRKQAIDFEKREVIRELLGVDLAAERSRTKGETDIYEERLGFLSLDKRMRTRMAIEQANQEEVALREASWLENDTLTSEEKTRLREIQEKKQNTLATLLTPDELDQYNLWFSPSAYKARETLSTLDPTEDDFLSIYRLQREFDAEWDGVQPSELDPERRAKYEKAQRDFEAGVKEYLGPDRFEKFVQARDPDFQQLQIASAQFALRPDVASDVYSFRQTLSEERAKVDANPNLSRPQRDQVFQALSEETEKAVVEVMGPKAYRYYLRNGAGKWIRGN